MACPSYRTELSLVGEGGGLVVCTIALSPCLNHQCQLAVLSWLAEYINLADSSHLADISER